MTLPKLPIKYPHPETVFRILGMIRAAHISTVLIVSLCTDAAHFASHVNWDMAVDYVEAIAEAQS